MKVCDICKNPSCYEHYVHTTPAGIGRTADLCGQCYKLLYEKENQHRFLAYKETVEEVTNEPIKKTWAQRFKFKR